MAARDDDPWVQIVSLLRLVPALVAEAVATCEDPERKEHVEFWDVDNIDTLDTYEGKIRAVRAVDLATRAGASW